MARDPQIFSGRRFGIDFGHDTVLRNRPRDDHLGGARPIMLCLENVQRSRCRQDRDDRAMGMKAPALEDRCLAKGQAVPG